MCVSKQNIVLVGLITVSLLYILGFPRNAFADGTDSNTPSTKTDLANAKPGAPAPLTERERWLLDRVEQLEKRVSELESKGNGTPPGRCISVSRRDSAPTC